jgi:predicted small secreted protein
MKNRSSFFVLALSALLLASCETFQREGPDREALAVAIRAEPPGDYFIGRRMFKKDYKMWGWVREPGKPWKSAKLVMMNEQVKLAPDRVGGKLGTDNNFEYRLDGRFTGEMVYEPASDRFYPEFQLTGYELISQTPSLIYIVQRQEDPEVRIIAAPPH